MYKECPKCFCNVSEEYDVCPYCNANLKNAKIKNLDVIKEENNGLFPNENGIRCIAYKSKGFPFAFVTLIFLFLISVGMVILGILSNDTHYSVMGVTGSIISLISLIWTGHYAFSVPKSVMFYDQNNKLIIVHRENSEKINIYLKDIEYVEQDVVHNRYETPCYHNFKIHITGNRIIEVSGISIDNDVMKIIQKEKNS
ncbi:MAG: hypothetical protein K6E20_02875 [Acholeplasmatales bacterium]|nr:hypothetical protein [Acholeplasmatales bacterium]